MRARRLFRRSRFTALPDSAFTWRIPHVDFDRDNSGSIGESRALAYGLGLPVIATPVGGLSEQIREDEPGLIAQSVSAGAIADAMQPSLQDAQLRARLLRGVAQAQADFSMARFFQFDHRARPALTGIPSPQLPASSGSPASCACSRANHFYGARDKPPCWSYLQGPNARSKHDRHGAAVTRPPPRLRRLPPNACPR